MDAAIVDGAAHMLNLILSARQNGLVADVRGQSIHDSAPFYDTYVCADGHHITLGALEPQFYALLLDTLGLADGPKTRTSQARNGTRPLGPRAGRGWRLCFWRGTRALASTAGVHRCLLWRRDQCRGNRRAPAHARAACTPSTRALSRPCRRRASTQVLPMRLVICVPLARTRKR